MKLGENGFPDREAFERASTEGRITLRNHREAPNLVIANYTPQTAFSRGWDAVTSLSRGLILDWDSGEVLALPLTKFFNLYETLEGDAQGNVLRRAEPQDGPFEATVKMDGSLGICYRLNGEIRWATRGSFHSEQADAANAIWKAQYRHLDPLLLASPLDDTTLLTEIIHPSSRVVVRYGYEDLVLIAMRSMCHGEDYAHERVATVAHQLGMRCVERVDGDLASLTERALTLDDNQEGFVLRWSGGYRLKVKGEQYKFLHKIVTGFTPKRMAEAWMEEALLLAVKSVPEEFRAEAEAMQATLDGILERLLDRARSAHADALEVSGGNRGEYARFVQKLLDRSETSLCFLLLDGKPIEAMARKVVYKAVEPALTKVPRKVSADES